MYQTKEIVKLINEVKLENISLYMLFKSKSNINKNSNKKWEVYQMKTSENLVEDILNLIKQFLKSIIESKSFDEIPYKPGPNNPKNIVSIINKKELFDFNEIKNEINNCSKIFKNPNIKGFKPFVYLIKLNIVDKNSKFNSILFFQHIQKQNALKKGIVSIFNQKFDSIKEEMFYISNTFDCLCINNSENMIIFNKQHFDWIFGFEEKFKNEIKERFETYDKLNNMINVNEFLNFILNDYILIRKTYNLLQNNNFYKFFNKETIKKVEEEANISEINWGEDGKIIIDKDNIKKLLNILNEDYLKSIVSNNTYLSLNKINL